MHFATINFFYNNDILPPGSNAYTQQRPFASANAISDSCASFCYLEPVHYLFEVNSLDSSCRGPIEVPFFLLLDANIDS
jgi:hypothetical protein